MVESGLAADRRVYASSTAPSRRKVEILAASERYASLRHLYRKRAAFFHEEDLRYLKFLIPKGLRVLELGCGTGAVLAGLEPKYGLGIDFSPAMINEAKRYYAHLDFRVGDIENPEFVASLEGPFDVILIVDTIGSLDDCQAMFENLHHLCTRSTRIVVAYYSHLWQPLLTMAEWLGWRAKQAPQNVMSIADVSLIAKLADYDTVKTERRLLSPMRLWGLGRFLNRFVSPLPILRHLGLRHYGVFRSLRHVYDGVNSASIIIPARNERGNIEEAIQRIPRFCDNIEIIFVEGSSSDGTYEEIQRVADAYPELDIKLIKQTGKGKADAVFAGFDAATGDVLIILDADLTMPPEQLPKFWRAITDCRGEFISGSRLIYPMDEGSMRFLNLVANRCFSLLFSWLLNQPVTDTLCGTKVLRRSDYQRLKQDRAYFGDIDPFGDFEMIFGAAKHNLKYVEIPIRYANRTYGATQISRFRDGILLLRMSVFAFLRIKAL